MLLLAARVSFLNLAMLLQLTSTSSGFSQIQNLLLNILCIFCDPYIIVSDIYMQRLRNSKWVISRNIFYKVFKLRAWSFCTSLLIPYYHIYLWHNILSVEYLLDVTIFYIKCRIESKRGVNTRKGFSKFL